MSTLKWSPGGFFERKVSAHAERILSTFSCGFRVNWYLLFLQTSFICILAHIGLTRYYQTSLEYSLVKLPGVARWVRQPQRLVQWLWPDSWWRILWISWLCLQSSKMAACDQCNAKLAKKEKKLFVKCKQEKLDSFRNEKQTMVSEVLM